MSEIKATENFYYYGIAVSWVCLSVRPTAVPEYDRKPQVQSQR